MAHEIVERTVAGETDKRLLLDGVHSLVARTMSIGTAWNKIRIGLRFSTQRTTDWAGAPILYVGVSSGITNPAGSTTPDHFLGIRTSDIGGNDWNALGTEPAGMRINRPGGYPIRITRIIDGVEAFPATGHSIQEWCVHCSNVGRSGLFVEITKGTPNFSVYSLGYVPGTPNAAHSMTLTKFNDIMDMSSISETNYTAITNGSFAVDETTNGSFDTISLAFNASSHPFEISDLAYARLA